MSITIALAGNPNSGKTTVFNELTGSAQYVGNWPGVTVEKKEGFLKNNKDIKIVDLPGIYSLSPYTPEEVVTRDYLVTESTDVIINIVDATNIERNLYLTTQLAEVGIPVVIALNMMDLVNRSGNNIDSAKLSEMIGFPVTETSALKSEGLLQVIAVAVDIVKNPRVCKSRVKFSENIEECLKSIEKRIEGTVPQNQLRWYAVKLFEKDAAATKTLELNGEDIDLIRRVSEECENRLDEDSESIIITERYQYISKLLKESYVKNNNDNMTTSDRIDAVVTNRFLALPIFALVMFLMYFVSVTWLGSLSAEWMTDVLFGDIVSNGVSNALENWGVALWLQGLIVDGLIAGVGSVLSFLPQIAMLFFFITLLEDVGYMTRVAFIMDKLFKNIGLSGKSFIPMLIGSGCSVPGIMASRTIENQSDRKMTVILTPFIPCSAKLPVFAMFIGTFFPNNPFVAPSIYFLGIATITVSGLLLKRTPLFSGDVSPFVMELPKYHMPSIKSVIIHIWERVKSFVIKAGTIIFLASAAVWFLSSFSFGMEMVDTQESILASIGTAIAPIFAPLGFGNWESSVAALTGLMAKENVVATFGVLFGTYADAGLSALFNDASAFSFMAFTLLAAPCVSAIGATKSELGSWKWTLFAIGYQTVVAYVVSFVIYQCWMLFPV